MLHDYHKHKDEALAELDRRYRLAMRALLIDFGLKLVAGTAVFFVGYWFLRIWVDMQ